MATVRTNSYKNVNGDYTINTSNTGGAGYGNLYINGNLIVFGSSANVIPTEITDSFITVAANNTGALTDMGILAQTGGGTGNAGPQTFAGLRFDTANSAWQVSSDVYGNGDPIAQYINIATGNIQGVAGNNTQLQFNNGGDFGGAANLNYIITGTNTGGASVLKLSGIEQLTHIGAAQTSTQLVANNTLLFGNPVSSGGTGLYFISPDPANALSTGYADELISKTKAIVYSIIF